MDKVRKQILQKLRNTYCRIKPSPVEGVGVFAIRDIPKGINPFQGISNQKWYELDMKDLKIQDKEILKLMDDFFVIEENKKVLIPENALNGMDISFFVNHSENPNIETIDHGFSFRTLRKILKGEELIVSYATYDDKYKKR
ncbi:SET domain-containing protein [Candidatus Woesearchaeota archaeon]|nr:SET domain-containing protein [Candidatus Woesearchaeota archaeon]